MRNSRTKIYQGVALSLGLLLSSAGCAPSKTETPAAGLALGEKFPGFSLSDSNGKTLQFSDVQKGWVLVLVFYRGNWCGVCRDLLLDLKDAYPQITALYATVAGVSVDSPKESAHFNQEWRFPFPLLADPKFQLISLFGLTDTKGHEGKPISHPAVVIVGSDGFVHYLYKWETPAEKPSKEQLLYVIQKIQKLPNPAGLKN